MKNIQKIKVLIVKLNKAGFISKKPLTEEQNLLGAEIGDISFSLFTSIKEDNPKYTIDNNKDLKKFVIDDEIEEEPDYKIHEYFNYNSYALYEMIAYKYIGKRKTYPTENHIFHISLYSNVCNEEYDIFFVSKNKKFYFFDDSMRDISLIEYISNYFIEIPDDILGQMTRLMENTKLDHEELQLEMNKIAAALTEEAKRMQYSLQSGVITFMDFLGWKGLWQNRAKNHLEMVNSLIRKVEEIVQEYTFSLFPDSTKIKLSRLISISDTIAIFTPMIKSAETIQLLDLHAKIAKFVLEQCVNASYPIRGAITFGEYNTKNNIMIGPGIDECASWHETCNWIGVHLSPSAELIVNDASAEKLECIIKNTAIPVKGGYPKVKYCVKWYVEKDIFSRLRENVPALLPEIAGKYMNTYDFLYGKEEK